MRTLERLVLIAMITASVGIESRAEEGPSGAPGGKGSIDASGSVSIPPEQDPDETPLGVNHLWVKFGQTDFQKASSFWGVDHGTYVGLEYYRAASRTYHFGGEIGFTSAGTGVTSEGETIRDFGYYALELNNKWVFELTRGITADVGFGAAGFWVQGDEVDYSEGAEYSSPLASFGWGVQAFADFTWRVRRFLIGVDVKHQLAADWVNLNYSNLRLGVHAGLTF